MGWFKADDRLAFHRKTLRAGNAALGLWVRAGTWCRGDGERADHPGVLTYAEARTMGTAAEIRALITAGFWEACKLDGERAIRFRNWNKYQPISASVEDKRDEWAARKRRQRKHRQGDHSLCLFEYCDEAQPADPPPETWSDHA